MHFTVVLAFMMGTALTKTLPMPASGSHQTTLKALQWKTISETYLNTWSSRPLLGLSINLKTSMQTSKLDEFLSDPSDDIDQGLQQPV